MGITHFHGRYASPCEKKNKPSMIVPTRYRLVKKIPMPMPSGLHKWFLKKCPAHLVSLKTNTEPTLVYTSKSGFGIVVQACS
jgi:hypothetical protein